MIFRQWITLSSFLFVSVYGYAATTRIYADNVFSAAYASAHTPTTPPTFLFTRIQKPTHKPTKISANPSRGEPANSPTNKAILLQTALLAFAPALRKKRTRNPGKTEPPASTTCNYDAQVRSLQIVSLPPCSNPRIPSDPSRTCTYDYTRLTIILWPNRDPITEFGGLNLYNFVDQNPLSLFDLLGREVLGDGRPSFEQYLEDIYDSIPGDLTNTQKTALRTMLEAGCIGVVRVHMGTTNLSYQNCFDTLENAKKYQETVECKGIKLRGENSKCRIFGVRYWNNGNGYGPFDANGRVSPPRSIPPFGRPHPEHRHLFGMNFDHFILDEATGLWHGANQAADQQGGMTVKIGALNIFLGEFWFFEDGAKYCVQCEQDPFLGRRR